VNRSEHEGYTDSGARKHSYRVMMRKGDNLLDMLNLLGAF